MTRLHMRLANAVLGMACTMSVPAADARCRPGLTPDEQVAFLAEMRVMPGSVQGDAQGIAQGIAQGVADSDRAAIARSCRRVRQAHGVRHAAGHRGRVAAGLRGNRRAHAPDVR